MELPPECIQFNTRSLQSLANSYLEELPSLLAEESAHLAVPILPVQFEVEAHLEVLLAEEELPIEKRDLLAARARLEHRLVEIADLRRTCPSSVPGVPSDIDLSQQ